MLLKTERDLIVQGDVYRLTFASDRPFMYLDDAHGHRLAELFALSGVQAAHGQDDTTTIGPWVARQDADEIIVSLRAGSSVWDGKTYLVRCTPQRFVYEVEVEGHGSIAEVAYFGGYCSALPRWGSGFFWSGGRFTRGFNPEPNAEEQSYFPPSGGAIVDVCGVPVPGRRHWFFTPAPFCFVLEAADGWLAMGVEAAAGAHRFTEYRYHGQQGFYLSLSYDGHTSVAGRYRLPAIGFDFAPSEYDALAAHIAAARRAAGAERPARAPRPAWWREPMFCGWGAQCYLAAQEQGYDPSQPRHVAWRAFVASLAHAPSYATQERYEEFLRALESHGLGPGIVVIDDKWQQTYGGNRVDERKWPDLRGFIAARHARGQKVLLWLKAWDREGVPDDQCIRNAAGVSQTIDPSHPAVQRLLRESVRTLLSADGYDADGFKIDFTARLPAGPGMQAYGDTWGLELLKLYLHTLYQEAKRTKADALVMTHTPHPYFADTLDMVRLNDMLDLTRLDDPDARQEIGRELAMRAAVARAACPDALIDTDNWPVADRAVWREYVGLQPRFGVPSLYFATHVDITQEPLDDDDYRLVRDTWQRYRSNLETD